MTRRERKLHRARRAAHFRALKQSEYMLRHEMLQMDKAFAQTTRN